MPYAKGPDQERYRWFSCVVGDYIIPTDPNSGAIVVSATSEQKVDAKKASGKDKAKTTQQGREPIKGSIEWEFTAESWADGEVGSGVETVLEYLDPNGPKSGGPFDFAHPDTDRRGVKAIMVTKVDTVVWKGHLGKCKIEWIEWNDPDKKGNAGAGGDATKTADKPTEWNDGGGRNNAWGDTAPKKSEGTMDSRKPNANP